MNDMEGVDHFSSMKLLTFKETETEEKMNNEDRNGSDAAVACRSTTTIFSLLPEIWEVILPSLSSQDFKSLTNTCPQWSQQFQEEKPHKLFPLVANVLLHYVPLSTTLLLRRVNQETKESIDEELAKVASDLSSNLYVDLWHCPEKKLNNVQKVAEKIESRYSLWGFNRFDKFVTSFNLGQDLERGHRRNRTSNPFLLRKVDLGYFPAFGIGVQGQNRFPPPLILPLPPWENICNDFGHHLWFLNFHIHDSCAVNMKVHALKLIMLLNSMPNLKVLRLTEAVTKCPIMECSVLRRGAYPQLPSLHRLEVKTTLDNPYSSDDFMLPHGFLKQYGAQLETLICPGPLLLDSNQDFLRLPNLSSHFQNLSRLRVDPIFGRVSFLKLAKVSCPLKDLHIRHLILNNPKEPNLKISDLVTVINNFADTLVDLGIFLALDYHPLDNDWDQMNPEHLKELPKLKKFDTDFVYSRFGWLWPLVLTKFPKLEEVVMKSYLELFYNQRRDLARGFNLLPRLKTIVAWWGWELDENLIMTRGDATTPPRYSVNNIVKFMEPL
ncbi:unnamed protein product [Orchesella dallaii]|uniref:F-box domain-containing protein n=1 Tax=Orchesella dallaii TaxID=48710 RepID=A0ABP1RTV1_9HEXA